VVHIVYAIAIVLVALACLVVGLWLGVLFERLFGDDSDELNRYRSCMNGIASCGTCGACRGAARNVLEEFDGYAP
jgi:hypothetical protein